MKNLKLPGLLLFLAGSIALMGIITSEAFYPAGYSTRNSEISDLGQITEHRVLDLFSFSIKRSL